VTTAAEPRFAFGKNWTEFALRITERQIAEATARLTEVLGDLAGKSFLDVGCGSGIHSLAAARLGARRVYSFDYDQNSVECARDLKHRFAPDASWEIAQGSALDESFLKSLGNFDVVYAWGVLHHTGEMHRAMELVTIPASHVLFISIYNDQGALSKFWKAFKRRYNVAGAAGRRSLEAFAFALIWGGAFLLKPRKTIQKWRGYARERGMSPWHDVVDWAGGYPFEVATADEVIAFYSGRGFTTERVMRVGTRSGCNEFVFRRHAT